MKSKNKEYWEILLIIPAAFLISNSSISSAQFTSQSETHELNFAGISYPFQSVLNYGPFQTFWNYFFHFVFHFGRFHERNWTNKIWRIAHVIFYRWHFYRIFRASKFFASFTSHTIADNSEHFWITSHSRENK